MDENFEYQQDIYKKISDIKMKKEEDWMKISTHLMNHSEDFDEIDHNIFVNLTAWKAGNLIKKITVCVGIPYYFYKFGFPETPNKMLKALGITYAAIPIFFKTLEEEYYLEQIQQIMVYKYKNLACSKD